MRAYVPRVRKGQGASWPSWCRDGRRCSPLPFGDGSLNTLTAGILGFAVAAALAALVGLVARRRMQASLRADEREAERTLEDARKQAESLRKEAEARGVSPERLIFGPACDGSERMARAKVASRSMVRS